MNRQEAARVVAYIAAPFQGDPLEADGFEVWFRSALESRDFEESMEVAVSLVGGSEFRPTPAAFNAAWRQQATRPGPAKFELGRAPDSMSDREKVAGIIADLRDRFGWTRKELGS